MGNLDKAERLLAWFGTLRALSLHVSSVLWIRLIFRYIHAHALDVSVRAAQGIDVTAEIEEGKARAAVIAAIITMIEESGTTDEPIDVPFLLTAAPLLLSPPHSGMQLA